MADATVPRPSASTNTDAQDSSFWDNVFFEADLGRAATSTVATTGEEVVDDQGETVVSGRYPFDLNATHLAFSVNYGRPFASIMNWRLGIGLRGEFRQLNLNCQNTGGDAGDLSCPPGEGLYNKGFILSPVLQAGLGINAGPAALEVLVRGGYRVADTFAESNIGADFGAIPEGDTTEPNFLKPGNAYGEAALGIGLKDGAFKFRGGVRFNSAGEMAADYHSPIAFIELSAHQRLKLDPKAGMGEIIALINKTLDERVGPDNGKLESLNSAVDGIPDEVLSPADKQALKKLLDDRKTSEADPAGRVGQDGFKDAKEAAAAYKALQSALLYLDCKKWVSALNGRSVLIMDKAKSLGRSEQNIGPLIMALNAERPLVIRDEDGKPISSFDVMGVLNRDLPSNLSRLKPDTFANDHLNGLTRLLEIDRTLTAIDLRLSQPSLKPDVDALNERLSKLPGAAGSTKPPAELLQGSGLLTPDQTEPVTSRLTQGGDPKKAPSGNTTRPLNTADFDPETNPKATEELGKLADAVGAYEKLLAELQPLVDAVNDRVAVVKKAHGQKPDAPATSSIDPIITESLAAAKTDPTSELHPNNLLNGENTATKAYIPNHDAQGFVHPETFATKDGPAALKDIVKLLNRIPTADIKPLVAELNHRLAALYDPSDKRNVRDFLAELVSADKRKTADGKPADLDKLLPNVALSNDGKSIRPEYVEGLAAKIGWLAVVSHILELAEKAKIAADKKKADEAAALELELAKIAARRPTLVLPGSTTTPAASPGSAEKAAASTPPAPDSNTGLLEHVNEQLAKLGPTPGGKPLAEALKAANPDKEGKINALLGDKAKTKPATAASPGNPGNPAQLLPGGFTGEDGRKALKDALAMIEKAIAAAGPTETVQQVSVASLQFLFNEPSAATIQEAKRLLDQSITVGTIRGTRAELMRKVPQANAREAEKAAIYTAALQAWHDVLALFVEPEYLEYVALTQFYKYFTQMKDGSVQVFAAQTDRKGNALENIALAQQRIAGMQLIFAAVRPGVTCLGLPTAEVGPYFGNPLLYGKQNRALLAVQASDRESILSEFTQFEQYTDIAGRIQAALNPILHLDIGYATAPTRSGGRSYTGGKWTDAMVGNRTRIDLERHLSSAVLVTIQRASEAKDRGDPTFDAKAFLKERLEGVFYDNAGSDQSPRYEQLRAWMFADSGKSFDDVLNALVGVCKAYNPDAAGSSAPTTPASPAGAAVPAGPSGG